MNDEGQGRGVPQETPQVRKISPTEAVALMRTEKPELTASVWTANDWPKIPPIDQAGKPSAQGWLLLKAGVPEHLLTAWSTQELRQAFNQKKASAVRAAAGKTRDQLDDERAGVQARADALTAQVLDIPLAQAIFFGDKSSVINHRDSTGIATDREKIAQLLVNPEIFLGKATPQLLAFAKIIDSLTLSDFDRIFGRSKNLNDLSNTQQGQVIESLSSVPSSGFEQAAKGLFSPGATELFSTHPPLQGGRRELFESFQKAATAALYARYAELSKIDPLVIRDIKEYQGTFRPVTPDQAREIRDMVLPLASTVKNVVNAIVNRFEFNRGSFDPLLAFPLPDGSGPMTLEWLEKHPAPLNPPLEAESPESPPPDDSLQSHRSKRFRFPFWGRRS